MHNNNIIIQIIIKLNTKNYKVLKYYYKIIYTAYCNSSMINVVEWHSFWTQSLFIIADLEVNKKSTSIDLINKDWSVVVNGLLHQFQTVRKTDELMKSETEIVKVCLLKAESEAQQASCVW